MRLPAWIGSLRPPRTGRQAPPGSLRDRLAVLLALATVVGLGTAFFLSKGTQVLMPGPLSSAHGAIENCSACHTQSGSAKLSWIKGLVAGDPHADSKACLTCHKMPDTAFNAHGASMEALKQSTERLTKIAAQTPAPRSARAQSIAFPTDPIVGRGLYCATCHQEHQGAGFKLNKISAEQCRSCHVVKFDSFDGHHPKFENYPFKRRSRIIFDHAGHFGKHYPEVAKKDPERRIPDTCSTCHNSRDDKRVMAVAPFEQTCTGCHLDQIVGKERASGPKGVAFLTLPGIDLQSLKKRNASIGEWPDASDAALTPFMRVLISRSDRGRALIKTVDGLNLEDLSKATDAQIRAVTMLVWEIKGLFYALISGKASDVLGDLNIGAGAKLSANLVADLTASIPRDVVISAHQQWLPNLATEMASRPVTKDQDETGWNTTITDSNVPVSASAGEPSGWDARIDAYGRLAEGKKDAAKAAQPTAAEPQAAAGENDAANAKRDSVKEELSEGKTSSALTESRLDGSQSPEKPTGSDAPEATPSLNPEAADNQPARKAIANPQACIASFFGQCMMTKGSQDDNAIPKPEGGKEKSPPEGLPLPMQAGLKEVAQAGQPEEPAGKTEPQGKAADQSDDLLFPSEEELRAMKAGNKGAAKAGQPEGDTAATKPDGARSADAPRAEPPAGSDTAAAEPQRRGAPVVSIQSDVDSESWAEYGGWYQQDYAIFYRPTGHKDKLIYSWLFLTGPQAPKGGTSPAAAVFDYLTSKDAQGSCTKCHSVENIQGKGRIVNFSPPSVASKKGRFTNFIHEPHFGILENRVGVLEDEGGTLQNRGCLTCHTLEKGRPYLKSYEQGNPQNFVSNFGEVKKELCQSCHTASMARQDCLLCHKYHVNGVITPIMTTKIPAQ